MNRSETEPVRIQIKDSSSTEPGSNCDIQLTQQDDSVVAGLPFELSISAENGTVSLLLNQSALSVLNLRTKVGGGGGNEGLHVTR